jgi:16S rRNA processing protein RimM
VSVRLVIGRIARPHGVRGGVVVDVRTDDPEERFVGGSVLATEPAQVGPLTVERYAWHSGRLLVWFSGVADRVGADRLRGTLLFVDSDDLPSIDDPDEFRDHELIDLTVVETNGNRVGTVADVVHLPGQDVLVVRREDGREAMVPFVSALVPEVDPAAKRIVVDAPAGLLDT